MEAKDTVISDKQLEVSIRRDYKDFRVADETSYSQDILAWAREAQAEISFKAGIREVVGWVNEQIAEMDRTGYYPKREMWQAKLKEWGV